MSISSNPWSSPVSASRARLAATSTDSISLKMFDFIMMAGRCLREEQRARTEEMAVAVNCSCHHENKKKNTSWNIIHSGVDQRSSQSLVVDVNNIMVGTHLRAVVSGVGLLRCRSRCLLSFELIL